MPAHFFDYALFGDQFSTAELRQIFDESAMLQNWLDIEAALAEAEAATGLIPASVALEIRAKAKLELLDLGAVKRGLAETVHPLVPLIRELTRVAGPAGEYVHWGATTQDILDTGLVLQLKAAYRVFRRDLVALIECLADLAERYRETVMTGRTHGQHALPITFGFKVAVWIAECLRHLERLDQSAPRILVGQLAGAVGTLAGFGPRPREVQRLALERLGLGVPAVAWHTARDGVAEFVALAGLIGATLGKMAGEVAMLQRTEVAEVEEPFAHGKVGSSTMPHKRNPAHCERVVAISKVLRAPVAAAVEAMVQLHERDTSASRTDWLLVPEAACLLGAALRWSLHIFRGLAVRPERMAKNLDLLGGMLCSEAVMLRLGETLGRQTAHDVVYEAAMAAYEKDLSFRDQLLSDPRVAGRLTAAELDRLLEPGQYVGQARAFVDEVVARARRTTRQG